MRLAAPATLRHPYPMSDTRRWVPRLLPPEEIARVREAGGPLNQLTDAQLAEWAEASAMLVVEDPSTGRVVGYCPLWRAPHWEPLWLAEEARHKALRPMLDAMLQTMAAWQVPVAFAFVADSDVATTGAMAERFGFRPVPGKAYFLEIKE